MKIAMIDVDRELRKRGLRSRIVLQIHDELLIEAPLEEEEEVKNSSDRPHEACGQLTGRSGGGSPDRSLLV